MHIHITYTTGDKDQRLGADDIMIALTANSYRTLVYAEKDIPKPKHYVGFVVYRGELSPEFENHKKALSEGSPDIDLITMSDKPYPGADRKILVF